MKLIIDRKPNVFIYGEAQIAIPHDLNRDIHIILMHRNQLKLTISDVIWPFSFYTVLSSNYLKLMQVTNLISYGFA